MKTFLGTVLLVSVAMTMQAQERLTIENVRKAYLRSSGTIIENEQIRGYFFFYQSDKVDRNTNEYTLQITDANLNKVKDIKFTDSKHINLLESSYNGQAIAFVFYDEDQKSLDYRLYDMQGKKINSYVKTLDRRSNDHFKAMYAASNSEESENQNLFDIKDKGFVTVTPLREDKKYTYEMSFYGSDKRKTWTFNPAEDGKWQAAQYLGANDSIAVLEVISKDKIMSKDVESTLIGVNLTNGRKAFETRTVDGGQELYPMHISTTGGANSEFLLIGPYYNSGDNVMQDKSKGLGIWLMNNQGKILRSKYNAWDKEIGKFLKVDQKGRIADLGYVHIHNMLRTEDGKFFAIGEGYRKTANAAGIAMAVLSGGGRAAQNLTKLVITDMLMLQFDDKFEVTSAEIHQKNNNTISMGGLDFASPHTIAMVAKAAGFFDYTFTQAGKNKGSFVTGYTDYERTKDYKGLTYNSISYADGAMTTDKINLKTSSSRILLLPAKPGSVMLVEYFRKEKKLDVRLEKIN